MDFSFTEEQTLLRNMVQGFLQDKYDFETRRKIVASDEGWSKDFWQEWAELGLLAAPFSEEQGGMGGGAGIDDGTAIFAILECPGGPLYFKATGGYRAEVLAGHAADDEKFTGGVEGPGEA